MSTTIEGSYTKATELIDRKPTMDDVRRGLSCRALDYLDRDQAEIIHLVAAGAGWVMVIGDGGGGGCEWVYVQCSGKDEQWECSNVGYGGSTTALLDVLIRVEGFTCPCCREWQEESDLCCKRCKGNDA